MPSDATFGFRPIAIVIAFVMAVCLTATFQGAGPDNALAAHSSKVKPAKTIRKGRALVFKPHRLDADRLGRATLIHGGKRKGLSPKVVRRALANKGRITAKVPPRWVPNAGKHHSIKRKRKRIARGTRLVITVRGHSSPTPEPTVSDQLRVGIVTNAQGWDMNSQVVLDQTEPTGAKWIREDFSWATIEPRNNSWQWSRYDHLFLEAAQRDMRVLPVMIDTPSWAGSAWNDIPSDPTEFAQFSAKLADRYGPGGSFWQAHPEIGSYAPAYFEIWNEPYLDYFSAGGVNPGRYARLVKAASSAGTAANSRVHYLLAAEQAPSGDRNTFIDGMYAAVPNLNSYFDGVAAHPYSGSSAPDEQRDGWGFPRIADIHQKFIDHGAGDKPLWITEIGWSTCPSDPTYCTSEKNQAAYLSQMFTLLSTKYSKYVAAAFVYHRTDLNSKPSDKEGWFGLERLDGSHKPAFDVFRAAALAGAS